MNFLPKLAKYPNVENFVLHFWGGWREGGRWVSDF